MKLTKQQETIVQNLQSDLDSKGASIAIFSLATGTNSLIAQLMIDRAKKGLRTAVIGTAKKVEAVDKHLSFFVGITMGVTHIGDGSGLAFIEAGPKSIHTNRSLAIYLNCTPDIRQEIQQWYVIKPDASPEVVNSALAMGKDITQHAYNFDVELVAEENQELLVSRTCVSSVANNNGKFLGWLKFETSEQVKKDAWIAEFAMLLVKQCHYSLESAISSGKASLEQLLDLSTSIDDVDSPQEAVDEEISAMQDSL